LCLSWMYFWSSECSWWCILLSSWVWIWIQMPCSWLFKWQNWTNW
jgi:hypothetical protein